MRARGSGGLLFPAEAGRKKSEWKKGTAASSRRFTIVASLRSSQHVPVLAFGAMRLTLAAPGDASNAAC